MKKISIHIGVFLLGIVIGGGIKYALLFSDFQKVAENYPVNYSGQQATPQQEGGSCGG
jgi:hypothetical protein